MHTAREILRLMFLDGMGDREIARSCNVSHVTVGNYRDQTLEEGLTHNQLEQMDDKKLEMVLKNKRGRKHQIERPQPDFSWIHKELKKKGVTRQLLWEEYKEQHPEGYEKSQFNDLYRIWSKKLDLSMRQSHKAGEKVFVDYSGLTVPVTDPKTGSKTKAEIFTAVLGASNYTYAEATWDQSLPSWIRSHVNAFNFFGGVPELVVPDNLKSGVHTPCRYDPEINRSYHEMSVHYDTAILPARVRKPKDKAKAEVGVQIVQRWILAVFRNREFFSLEELNREISVLLTKLNQKPFKKMKGSRLSLFELTDKPHLKPLPQVPFVFAKWKKIRVSNDYHVELEGHYYSVPYSLVKQQVDLRVTDKTIEVFFHSKRVASHLKKNTEGGKTTTKEHMPKSHRSFLEVTPSVITAWSFKVGQATHEVIHTILNSKQHPDQSYRSCLGIMRMGKRYSNERMEAACQRAVTFGSCSYRSLKSILEKGLDQHPITPDEPGPNIEHTNIRGKSYYDSTDNQPEPGGFLC